MLLKIRNQTNINIGKYIHTLFYESNIFETVLEALGTQAECSVILVLFHVFSGVSLHTRHPFPRREVAMALQPVHLCQLEPVAIQ